MFSDKKFFIIVALTLTNLFLAFCVLRMNINPLVDTYDQYNHITIYEDGSYSGQYRHGYSITGCIKNAPCQD